MKYTTYDDALQYVKQIIYADLLEEEGEYEEDEVQHYVQLSTRILAAESFSDLFAVWHNFENMPYSTYIPRVLDAHDDAVLCIVEDEQ